MMNEMLYNALAFTHMIAGIAGLATFWLPVFAKKGGLVHRAAGKVFLVAMLLVTVTGVPLAAQLIAVGQWVFGVFLLYVAVLLGTSVSSAWGAIRLKRDPERYYGAVHAAVAWLLLLSGATVSVLGYAFDVMLLLIFGFIGPLAALDMFNRRRAEKRPANWWLLEHFGGMIGGGIATHVAFGAFGLRQLWPAYASLEGWIGVLPWLLPVVVGTVASILLERHYRRPVAVNVPPVTSAG